MGLRDPKVALITGASSGLGLALVRRLKQFPYRLVVTARESSLPRFSPAEFSDSSNLLLRALDVTSPENRRSLVEEITQRWGGIDILVNNAGVSFRSVVEHMSEADEILQLKTNYLGPSDLIRLVLPHMRKNRWGRIVNVSSVGGMMAMPTMGSYSASKFALEGMTEALWYELKPWNIAVTLLQPGFIHSESFRKVYLSKAAEKSLETHDEYSTHYHKMCGFIERLMTSTWATPEGIANKIVATLQDPNPPLRVPATIDAYFFSLLRRFVPRRFYHWLLYRNLPGINEWGNFHENQ